MYGKYECFVMQMLYVCVLCSSCGSSQFCILHDLQFVIGSHECLLLLPHPAVVSVCVICRGLCACTEMM